MPDSVIVNIDPTRRIVAYRAGGCEQQVYGPLPMGGEGWRQADTRDWPDAPAVLWAACQLLQDVRRDLMAG